MTTRSDTIRTWGARVWRCVLYALQALAGLDVTGQFTGWGAPHYPDGPGEGSHYAAFTAPDAGWALDPVGWAPCVHGAHQSPAVMTEVMPHAVSGRLPAFTPAEQARLRVLRARYQADRAHFTTRELAHLQFARWRHQTGRVIP
jgi:hypothetical protein